jgi:hypothetical protein
VPQARITSAAHGRGDAGRRIAIRNANVGDEVIHQPGSDPTGPDPLSSAAWRKSTASDANSGCVEVAFLLDGRVGVRDSKNRSMPALAVSARSWASFLADVMAGQFDLGV